MTEIKKDPFEKYKRIRGTLKLKIGEDEFEVKASVDDKVEFIRIKDGVTKGTVKPREMFDYAKTLLVKSYPEMDVQVIDDFLAISSNEFFDELTIAFGFLTREQVKEMYSKHYGAGDKKK